MYIFTLPITVDDCPKKVLVIFSGQLECTDTNFIGKIEKELQRHPVKPDEVLYLYPAYINEYVTKAVNEKGPFFSGITRFQSIPVSIISFDESAKLRATKVVGVSRVCKDTERLKRAIVQAGLYGLAKSKKDRVIMKAPWGTTFIKPSGGEYDEFIRAGELAVGDSEHAFVAFCLLTKKPADRVIGKILIDSSSISVYIEAMTFFLSKFSNAPFHKISYDSFNSYNDLDINKPDVVEDLWVIVSASLSNNLGIKIAKEWHLDHEQILTILSYSKNHSDRANGHESLVDISALSDSFKREKDTGSLLKVKVIGEHFTAEVEVPNTVMIKASHKTKEIASWIDPNKSNGLIQCNLKTPKGPEVSPVHINFDIYLNKHNTDLTQWLSLIVDWHIPTKVHSLIYDTTDTASIALATTITGILSNNGITSFNDVDFSEAETKVTGASAAIILTPVLYTGVQLLKLNRSLRISKHQGNRIYICPFVIFNSNPELDKFRNSLLYGPHGMKYQFFSKHQAFTGSSSSKNSWVSELNIIGNLSHPFWNYRSTQISKRSVGLEGHIGTPSLPTCEKLGFTKDFAFWKPGYKPCEINPEAMYLTVSTILQGLRDKKTTSIDNDSLYSYVYQHSVISPENFSRFNDGLIQSCLWRAASSRELDYRGGETLSQTFAEILTNLINDNATGVNNAALDLLMGIAMKKIKVLETHLKDIIIKGKESYSKNGYEHSKELVDYIYYNQIASSEELPDEALAF